jgi:hypothetical protein
LLQLRDERGLPVHVGLDIGWMKPRQLGAKKRRPAIPNSPRGSYPSAAIAASLASRRAWLAATSRISITGFAARPGTEVLPMWWISSATDCNALRSSRASAAKAPGQVASYGTTTTLRIIATAGFYRPNAVK